MSEFNWIMKGLARGISPEDAANELARIQNLYGKITTEVLVREATEKSSPLHSYFEWDDEKAGHRWRVQQARILLNNIQVKVVTDGEERQISVFEVTSANEGYKSIDTFTREDIEYVKSDIRSRLKALNEKMKSYNQFDRVREYVTAAIEAID